MKQKTTLILTFVMALAVGITANAGNTHSHPISVDKAVALMTKYFGWNPTFRSSDMVSKVGGAYELEPAGTKYAYDSGTLGRVGEQSYTIEFVAAECGDYVKDGSYYEYVGKPNGTHIISRVTPNEKGLLSWPAGYVASSYAAYYYYVGEGNGSYGYRDGAVPTSCTAGTPKIAVGDVIVVHVNEYWRGHRKSDASSDYSSVWNQCLYGVEDCEVVEPHITATGKLYVLQNQVLGRFFFAKRRASRYSEVTTVAGWYDEWSTVGTDTKVGWSDFAKFNHYGDFISGDVWYAPHNCCSSLEMNHFVSLIEEGDEGKGAGYNMPVLFYISDQRDSGNKGSGTVTTLKPFLTTYSANQIEPGVNETYSGSAKYNVTVKFNSTFNTALNAIGQWGEVMWDQTNGGVREFYEIRRVWVNYDGQEVDEVVALLPADSGSFGTTTIDGKTYKTFVDNRDGASFKAGTVDWNPEGYDVTYKITGELYIVDKNGNPLGNSFLKARTENGVAHIPGTEEFALDFTGASRCTYVPSTFNHPTESTYTINVAGTNNVKNVISAKTSNDDVGVAGDVIALYYKWGEDGEWTALKSESAAGKSLKNVISNNFDPCEHNYSNKYDDVYYQLRLVNNGTAKKQSRVIKFTFYAAEFNAGPSNRQGHPDVSAPATETIHNELKFAPDGGIQEYIVYKNGVEVLPHISQADIEAGIDPAGIYTYIDEYEAPRFVDEGEKREYDVPTNSYYAIAAKDKKGNTYGCPDFNFSYQGEFSELVYQMGTVKSGTKWNNSIIIFNYTVQIEPNDGRIMTKDVFDKCYKAELYGYTEVDGAMELTKVADISAPEFGNILTFQAYEKVATIAELGITSDPKSEQFKKDLADAQIKWVPKEVFAKLYFEAPAAMSLLANENGDSVTKFSNPGAVDTGSGTSWTGIDGVTDDDVKVAVYPNPATDFITVEGANGNVALYNASGAMVQSVNAQGTVTIDVTGLSKGVYFLKTGNVTEKILIK